LQLVEGDEIQIIFHITTAANWKIAGTEGTYRAPTFDVEGFIHCSTREQVIQVANARFRGQSGFVLLVIDAERVSAEIIFENLEGGEQLFPHIYGGLNIDAVVSVAEFEPGAHGYFALPPELPDAGQGGGESGPSDEGYDPNEEARHSDFEKGV